MGTQETEKSQRDRFREAARDVEADESDDALDKVMRKLDLTKKPDDATRRSRPGSSETES